MRGIPGHAAQVDLVITEREQAAWPVRDGLLGHAEALRRGRGLVVAAGLALASPFASASASDLARSDLRAATLARRISVRSAGWVLGSGPTTPGGRTTSLPSTFAW